MVGTGSHSGGRFLALYAHLPVRPGSHPRRYLEVRPMKVLRVVPLAGLLLLFLLGQGPAQADGPFTPTYSITLDEVAAVDPRMQYVEIAHAMCIRLR